MSSDNQGKKVKDKTIVIKFRVLKENLFLIHFRLTFLDVFYTVNTTVNMQSTLVNSVTQLVSCQVLDTNVTGTILKQSGIKSRVVPI